MSEACRPTDDLNERVRTVGWRHLVKCDRSTAAEPNSVELDAAHCTELSPRTEPPDRGHQLDDPPDVCMDDPVIPVLMTNASHVVPKSNVRRV